MRHVKVGFSIGLLLASNLTQASAAPGDVDLSFNANSLFPGSVLNQEIYAVVPQKDGKVLVSGAYHLNPLYWSSISRLNADGSRDNSFYYFEPDWWGAFLAVALQPDGKILVGGQFIRSGGSLGTNIARLNPDGSTDSTFLHGLAGAEANSAVSGIAVQNDGMILLSGDFRSMNGIGRTCLARLNVDGLLDADYAPQLRTPGTYPGAPRPVIHSLALQQDGKALISGYFNSVNGVTRPGVARINPDGTLDHSFDPNHLQPVLNDAHGERLLCLQQNGKILLYGHGGAGGRLNPDGSRDYSFSAPSLTGTPNRVAMQSDGKILLTGLHWEDTPPGPLLTLWIRRLNPDGSRDYTFDAFLNGSGFQPRSSSIAVLTNGKIMVGGQFTSANGASRTNIVQLMGDYAPLAITSSPQSQTAEMDAAVGFAVHSTGFPPPRCMWFYNTNTLLACTNFVLQFTNAQSFHSGAYTVVVTNLFGAATSSPAMLNVIPPVERRPVPGINLMGEAGSSLNLDYAEAFVPPPIWLPLATVSLASPTQFYFDLSAPLPPQRFYRAWQAGAPSVIPALDIHIIPAITLTGSVGNSVRVDGINAVGPIDAWFTLDSVTLTNISQLYFDVSVISQPPRLYRLVPVP